MHEYIYDTELVRLAILLGVVVSMVFYERFGVTTGGAIVPGYLAIFVVRPTQIVATLVIATLAYWIVTEHLQPRWMLWGRRLFETEILVALGLQTLWIGILLALITFAPQVSALVGIGFLLPGIIAHDMGRQGVGVTIWASLVCTLVVFVLITLIAAVRDLFIFPTADSEIYYRTLVEGYAYPIEWLLIGIIISVLTSIVLYHGGFLRRPLMPDALRTGGFVTAGYLALFVTQPLDLFFVAVCSVLTYLIVTRLLMKKAILFGRSKLAVMVLTGMTVTWAMEMIIALSGSNYVPWQGFSAITPMIVALLANDAQRQGPRRTVLGVGLSTILVFTLTSLLYFSYSKFT